MMSGTVFAFIMCLLSIDCLILDLEELASALHGVFLAYLACSQPCKARVIKGITTQVKSSTTKALKTRLFKTKFHEWISGPKVKERVMMTGNDPEYVAMCHFPKRGRDDAVTAEKMLRGRAVSRASGSPSDRAATLFFHST